MSAKISLFVPVNIGRNLERLLRRKAPSCELITPASSDEELRYFAKTLKDPDVADLPELIVTLHPQVLRSFDNPALRELYGPPSLEVPPLHPALRERGIESEDALVQPLLYAPVVMLVHRQLDDPPSSWADLLQPRFHGRILAPGKSTPVSLAFAGLFQRLTQAQDRLRDLTGLLDGMKYSGLPFDVLTGVNKGYYDVGILPLPFVRYGLGRNLQTVIPKEGALLLPEMMLARRDASAEALAIASELLGQNIQRFFAQLGALLPVHAEIPLPAELKGDRQLLWPGWGWYRDLATQRVSR